MGPFSPEGMKTMKSVSGFVIARTASSRARKSAGPGGNEGRCLYALRGAAEAAGADDATGAVFEVSIKMNLSEGRKVSKPAALLKGE